MWPITGRDNNLGSKRGRVAARAVFRGDFPRPSILQSPLMDTREAVALVCLLFYIMEVATFLPKLLRNPFDYHCRWVCSGKR